MATEYWAMGGVDKAARLDSAKASAHGSIPHGLISLAASCSAMEPTPSSHCSTSRSGRKESSTESFACPFHDPRSPALSGKNGSKAMDAEVPDPKRMKKVTTAATKRPRIVIFA